MDSTWIVVADSARARIFGADRYGHHLTELEDLSHPESRLHEGDLREGSTGSAAESTTAWRSGTGPTTSAHDRESEGFARDIGRYLHAARSRGRFETLVLVAGPDLLGALREHLDAQTEQCVAHEVHKNLAQHSLADIQAHVQPLLDPRPH